MRRFLFLCVIGFTALLTSAVMAEQAAAPAKPAAAKPAGQPVFRMVNSIQDIMEGIVAPSSDILFDAVATDITAQGVNEKKPTTDDDWERVEHAAIALVESMNMVKAPGRRVARPGEKTKSEGPDAPELTPEEITAKINGNRQLFLKYANELQTQAIKALEITRKHDVQGLFDIGEEIDNACESCHLEYWYPNDKQAKLAHEANLKLKAAEEAKKRQQQGK
jgi:hypothetical protein